MWPMSVVVSQVSESRPGAPSICATIRHLLHLCEAEGFYFPGLHVELDCGSFACRAYDYVFKQSCFGGADLLRELNGHVPLAAFYFNEAGDGVHVVEAFHLLERVENYVIAIGLDEGVGLRQAALLSGPLLL